MPVPVLANATIRLKPARRRFAKTLQRIIEIIEASDNKQYNSGRAFVPIFPLDDAALQAAVLMVYDRAKFVQQPQPLGGG
jgi:hypothetical protein